ncbi:MAG: Iron-sulfur cluster carrier protein [Candidatus Thorarchaeota archaeon]|nr:MAG: Iron-sulfur cluster carrier protein [Candidatus Thorarchaeota archaeon]
MIIAVASGKGGTGKTTVAVNLALSVGKTNLIDCDVEEPNVPALLSVEGALPESVYLPTPVVDQEKCTLCGKCAEFCQFNAILVGKTKTIVYPEICHSCGGCMLVCPENAIHEENREVGVIYTSKLDNLTITYGELTIGEPMATPIIGAVKTKIVADELNILDSPPGTACPVIETIHGSDYVILVTEPTPFGLHDLSMAVDVVRELGIPHGVIINRAGIGDESVKDYCIAKNIPLLLEIPFDRNIAELYSNGIPFVREMPEYREQFKDLLREIEEAL